MPSLLINSECIRPELHGHVLVNRHQLPRFWPTIWAEVFRGDDSASTRRKRLSAIERLYESCAVQFGDDRLDRLITALDVDALEEVLTGFAAHLRNYARHNSVDTSPVWTAALDFVLDLVDRAGLEHGHVAEQMRERLNRLERLYRNLKPNPKRDPAPLRAIPASVVEELYELFNPTSPRNPFRTEAQRWRNLFLFLILLRLGLRRGETALLADNSFQEEFDPRVGGNFHWLNIVETDDCDPRFEKPSLKTLSSQRQIPLPNEIVELRSRIASNRGRTNYSYLFMSQKGRPLSLRAISDIFEVASDALSKDAKRKLINQGLDGRVTPHCCRHTAVVVRLRRLLDNGTSLDEAIGKARKYFGWSHDSEMPTLYGKAFFETELNTVWNEKFDHFVDALRRVEPECWR